MGAIGGLSTPSGGISIPATETVVIALANTEQSYTFPANTKQFRIFNDGKYLAKVSYQATESGTNYYPVYPGDEYKVYGISAPSITIYVQSTGTNNLRLEYWR